MIVFDLQCGHHGHVFEAWFGSSEDYADQKMRGLLLCPICGATDVDKAVMAPNVAAKGNRGTAHLPVDGALAMVPLTNTSPAPQQMKAMLAALAQAQAEALKSSTWVGRNFAQQARAMDAGEVPQAQIHGEATQAQAQELLEEGIGVMPLLIPVVPPEQRN
ncbi:MAG: DUF1178 family protein [Alphaproteobacteria bacterium]|nr:DUF1178 family protein [Alphaproteobacteria bacterium]MDE2042154.1 DUF1178 family protein [Alphaproteobacteria bacterium]MDE2340788.1 DUF1178 family protein [Alphaproteobacteria bacterium]